MPKAVKPHRPKSSATTSTKTKKQASKPRSASVESASSSLSEPDDGLGDVDGGSSEDELEEEEGVVGMSEKEAQKVLDDEVPRDPSGLFDDDDGIEMASVRSGRSRGSSSEASRPPTSESEGMCDDQLDESSDREEEVEEVPQKQKPATNTKGPSKRDTILASERPATISSRSANKSSKVHSHPTSTVRIESDMEDNITPEEKWPAHARLNTGALLQQNPFIRAVCRDAIKIVERALFSEHAWPELHRAAVYKRQVLSKAVEPLIGKDKRYKDIQKRIVIDDGFVKISGKWVIDRLSHHRGTIHAVASDHIAMFQLGINDGCKERIRALTENDVYVFPGEWGTTEKGKPIWVTKGSTNTDVQIYLNPGLIDVIKDAYFTTSTGFGYKYKELYVSSHPSLKEPELTIPLVALGATAFFAAIWEWREGKRPVVKSKSKSKSKSNEKFDGNIFKTVFDRHVETLTGLKLKVNTFHSIMSTLYSKVTDENTPTDFGTRIQGNTLAVLDLSGLD